MFLELKKGLTAPKKNAENDKKFFLNVYRKLIEIYQKIYELQESDDYKYEAYLNRMKSVMAYIQLADEDDEERIKLIDEGQDDISNLELTIKDRNL